MSKQGSGFRVEERVRAPVELRRVEGLGGVCVVLGGTRCRGQPRGMGGVKERGGAEERLGW